MAEKFLTLEQVSVSSGSGLILDSIDLSIRRGEQWAIIGPSGSGKTVLAQTLLGRHFYSGLIEFDFSRRIAIVTQQHRFKNLSGTTDLYYQQRFNSQDADLTITVEQELREHAFMESDNSGEWIDSLHIRHLLSKPLVQLSNGENKRVQLAIALSEDPELLILDNPFTGLDAEGRKTLHQIINLLAAKGIQILLISSAHEIPEAITHVAQLEKGRLVLACPKEDFHPRPAPQTQGTVSRLLPQTPGGTGSIQPGVNGNMQPGTTGNIQPGAAGSIQLDPGILARLKQPDGEDFSVAVKMVNTIIRYGETIILKGINWEVRKGEKWNLSGPNGAGKSTLLSLVTADNPQAYANEIWLFDRRRGSGESIWDIKRKIGYVSPELHLYFDYSATCFEVIASGLFDTIGLFRPLTPQQEDSVLLWMQLLSLGELRAKRLAELSAGGQRMVLLARALVKNPPMLILDEPCQGLDDEQTRYFKDLIDLLCEAFGTTLIYVSHYPQEIPACVNRFLQLENGAAIYTVNE